MKIKLIALMILLLPATVFSGANSSPQADGKNLLPECPNTPNCVSSLADNPGKRVDPFPVKGNPSRSVETLADIIRSMSRTTIVSESETRIEAEFRSILGFVDDILFVASPEGDVIHVRSASRKGSWDLGVNRRRVEKIRTMYLGNKVH